MRSQNIAARNNDIAEPIPTEPVKNIEIHGQVVPVYLGRVTELLGTSGVGVLVDGTSELHAFKFDAIPGFKGESSMSLGLSVGTTMEFALNNNQICYLRIFRHSL